MNKYYHKSKIFLLLALMCIAITDAVNAGGFLGSDRTICKGDTIKIGIGVSMAGGIIPGTTLTYGDCYRWESAGGSWMATPENHSTLVAPTTTTMYWLTVTSDDFSRTEKANIIIYVVDKINSITATAEQCC